MMMPPPEEDQQDDARLLQLLREDRIPVSEFLHWLHAHQGPGPPKDLLFPPDDPMIHQQWKEQLAMTTPQSFAVTFLNYVRTEVQPLIAVADSAGEMVVKSSLQPSETNQTKEPEMNSGAKETPNIGTENVSPFVGNKGGKDRRKSTGMILQTIQEPKRLQVPVYDDDFPVLGNAPNVNAKKNLTQSKQKRRVTPTPMVNPVVDSAFILAKVELPITAQQNHVNKSKLPGAGPVKVDMDILMQRCEKTRKQKQKEKPEAPKKENVKTWSWEKIDSRLGTNSSQELPWKNAAVGPSTEMKVADDAHAEASAFPATIQSIPRYTSTETDPESLTIADKERQTLTDSRISITESLPLHCLSKTVSNFASVHATLMLLKLVPSLLEELHFLLQLLSLEPAVLGASPGGAKSALISIAEINQEKGSLFANGDDCAGYATSVLEQAGRILDCVGEQILVALIEEPAIARHSATLLVRLKASLAVQQAAALRSFKAYETASRTNGVIEQSLTTGTGRLTPGLPVSLPFQAARDSRNIYKTQEEQRAYNNRELCRDQFYAIIREAASAYSAFGWISTGAEGEGYLKMKDSVRNFLQVLLVENYPWFAELFLEQVLQVSNCGETDPEVTSLARQDPAKLQRLHDRLTSTNTSRLPTASQKQGASGLVNGDSRVGLSPSSPWSKVKSTEQMLLLKKHGMNNALSTNNVQVLNKGRNSIGNGRERSTWSTDVGSKFSSYFPQSLCVYVWFLEAADSHRLSTQMMWSIKGKITILARLPPHSRDAADIGSGFTQRVLALKALAGLLGYLFVSPGAGARPPAPVPGVHDNGGNTLWDVARSEPPVDVPAVLAKAQMEGSVLLNLPWVLEFLRFLKADWLALSHPHFQIIVSSLRDIYVLPMLNPSSEHFGVGSICILASLDAFFEYMDLTPCNGEWSKKFKSNASPVKQKDLSGIGGEETRISEIQAEERPLAFNGLDTMLGIIDSRYIQHCCPLIMELRGVLVEGKRRRQRQREPNWPDSPAQPRARAVRKITPVQRPGPSQSLDISSNLTTGENVATVHGSDSQKDHLKLKLQRTFLEQRPHLRRVVDFVVDTAASNAARAAVLKVVPSALQNAQQKLQMVLRGNGGDASPATSSAWSVSKGSQVETAVEHIITTTIHQLLGPALDYAKGHAADRTAEALAALADPEESSFVLSVAAGIAAETAGQAACQKALASISGEVRKRITDDVETWRRKALLHGLDSEGSPINTTRRLRAQSWPRAGMQQLPTEYTDPLEIGIVKEVSGLSDLVTIGSAPIPEYRTSREPENEASPSQSSRFVGNPQGVLFNAIPTNSAMRTAIPSVAVKRQLSFSFKEKTDVDAVSNDFIPDMQLAEDQSEAKGRLANGLSDSSEASGDNTESRRCSSGSSLGENGQSRHDKSSSLRVNGAKEAQTRRWSVGSSSGETGPKKLEEVSCPLDRMAEEALPDAFANGAASGELAGPQMFAARIAEACRNASYYCSVKPFRDESRHFLRQHLAIICISLEGLLSPIYGATPAGGFDALVFTQDTNMQMTRFCERPSSNPLTSGTSRNPKLKLQVERGLVRRSVALAVHLLFWTPSVVLDYSCGGELLGLDVAEQEFLQKRGLSDMASRPPNTLSNGLTSSATRSRVETACLNGIKLTSLQEKKSSGPSFEVEWTIMHALTVTWKSLVESAILSKEFLLQELLTPWRWKLAMASQPWQGFVDGFFEDWSVTVQKGISSVLISLMGSGSEAFTEDFEIQFCNFVRVMSERNMFCENGAVSMSKDTPNTTNPNSIGSLSVSSVRTKQDRLVNRAESLAAGLAVLILQHYSPEACIDKVRVGNGQAVRSSKDAASGFIPLRKLVENLFLEGERVGTEDSNTFFCFMHLVLFYTTVRNQVIAGVHRFLGALSNRTLANSNGMPGWKASRQIRIDVFDESGVIAVESSWSSGYLCPSKSNQELPTYAQISAQVEILSPW